MAENLGEVSVYFNLVIEGKIVLGNYKKADNSK